jgi:large conductance mechanosensitive channel
MGMMKEFKDFAVRGNVVDMAVGIIIGGAFGTIVKSLVDDVLMPPIGLLLGGVDFANFFVVLREGASAAAPYGALADAKTAGAVTINYGIFFNAVISFLIVAFAVFMLVRSVNSLRRQEEAPPAAPTTKECPHCFSTIAIKASRCPQCTSELKPA